MRVLYIDHTLHKSGAAISLGSLVRALGNRVEPHFILRSNSEVEETLGAIGRPKHFERWMPQFMTTLRTPQYSLPLFLWHLAKIPVAFVTTLVLVRKWKIQIVHLNETALLPYVFIGTFLGIRVVMHARGATAQRKIEQYFLNLAGRLRGVSVIAIDEETKRSLPAACQEITAVVPNPVDFKMNVDPACVRRLRNSWGCTDDDVLVGQVASLHTSKGIWDILEMARILCPSLPHARFILIGDDRPNVGEGPELRKAVRDSGLEGRVILTGYLDDVEVAYGALDVVLCMFSKWLGGVGRAAYEAALAAKPLIATLPTPEVSSTMKDGITGLVFRPDDEDAILKALRTLIESPAKRSELGRSARQEIGQRHSPSRIAAQVESLYSSLIDDRPTGGHVR